MLFDNYITRSIWRTVPLVLAHNPKLHKRQGIDLVKVKLQKNRENQI